MAPSDPDSEFEEDKFDEDKEASTDSATLNLAKETPVHCDGSYSGDTLTDRKKLYTPRALSKLCGQKILNGTGKFKVQNRDLPPFIFPLLLGEALKMGKDESISYVVSVWPLEILDLNEIEMPPQCQTGFFTRYPTEIPLSDSIKRGLFYRSRRKCRLRMLVLPKYLTESAEILRTFIRISAQYLKDLPDPKLPVNLQRDGYHEGEKYFKAVPKLEMKRPTSYAVYNKDKVRVVIVIPAVAVHFVGKKQNYDDIMMGLLLQRYSPFLFHFENVAICNYSDVKYVGAILDRMVNPQGVRKLVLRNKLFYKPENVFYMLNQLGPVLKKFTNLEGLFIKITAMLGNTPKDYVIADSTKSIESTFSVLRNVTKAAFCNQPIGGHLGSLIMPFQNSLVKLSLVRSVLTSADFDVLGNSHHAKTLRFLNLDYTDLRPSVEGLLRCLPKLESIQILQMRNCMLSAENCLSCAAVLEDNTTLRLWTITHNYLHKLTDLRECVTRVYKIITLKEFGCRPVEYVNMWGRLLMLNRFMLSENEKDNLLCYGNSLELDLL